MTFDLHKNNMAWAAGLFEGEGCIVAARNGGSGHNRRVQLTLGTTDRDVLERFVSVVGVGNINVRPTASPRHRPLHVWTINGRQCVPVLESFMPWLGVRRAERAKAAIQMAAELRARNGTQTHCPRGHPYDDSNTYLYRGSRQCRACGKAANGRQRLRRKMANAV